jgi:hypothetical protein
MLEIEGQLFKPARSKKKKMIATSKKRNQLPSAPVASAAAAPLLYKDDIINGLRTQIKQQ